jgi:DNA-binding protein Fis
VAADPLKLPLEELVYLRLGHFLDQLHGRKVPELYRTLLDQVDRAVVRQALERSAGQLSAAAGFLGVDRNTLARKVKRLRVRGKTGTAGR